MATVIDGYNVTDYFYNSKEIVIIINDDVTPDDCKRVGKIGSVCVYVNNKYKDEYSRITYTRNQLSLIVNGNRYMIELYPLGIIHLSCNSQSVILNKTELAVIGSITVAVIGMVLYAFKPKN